MCPYALFENINGITKVTCEPKKEMCTLCVCGNAKTYKEITEERQKRMRKGGAE